MTVHLHFISGTAGGKLVAAAKINEACGAFGFPFRRVKCCRDMDCQCMEYRRKLFVTKRQPVDGDGATLCIDCGHKKDLHYVLETLVVVYIN